MPCSWALAHTLSCAYICSSSMAISFSHSVRTAAVPCQNFVAFPRGLNLNCYYIKKTHFQVLACSSVVDKGVSPGKRVCNDSLLFASFNTLLDIFFLVSACNLCLLQMLFEILYLVFKFEAIWFKEVILFSSNTLYLVVLPLDSPLINCVRLFWGKLLLISNAKLS